MSVSVLCRDRKFPEQYRPEVEAALEKVGLRLDEFRMVDNTCPPHPVTNIAQNIKGALTDIMPGPANTAVPPINVDESKTPQERAGLVTASSASYRSVKCQR